jgi:hypothetical protein
MQWSLPRLQVLRMKNMNILLITPNGSPFLPAMYSTVTSGSAFYKDEFMPATIFFEGTSIAKSAFVRLDLVDNSIHYLNDKKEEFIINKTVEKLVFENPENAKEIFVSGNSLPTENASYKNKWYLVLQQNDLTVYKLYTKKIFEYKPFNSGILEKTIETYEKYFIIKDGILVESKKSRMKN